MLAKLSNDTPIIGKEDFKQITRHFGNDVTFFGRQLYNKRLQIAFYYGWMLERKKHENTFYYILVPPNHYECAKNNWTATYKNVDIDGYIIAIPCWYEEDNVLMKGRR